MNIVDRRPNPKGKSLSNRQRFLSRARAEVKSAVQNALRKRKVADVEHGEKVAIPTRGIVEPVFHHSRRTGRAEHVVPGNKEYVRGDEIPRPTVALFKGTAGRPGTVLARPVPDVTISGRFDPASTEPSAWITGRSSSQFWTNLEKSWLKARWITPSDLEAPSIRLSGSAMDPR